MNRIAVLLILTSLFSGTPRRNAPLEDAKRPRILGISHMALYVGDLQKSRAFIKINEDQYLELFAENPKQDGRLNHISFFTDDAERMRAYLASRGVRVPDNVGKGKIGNSNFNITDPDGHTVEIVQYQPDSWTRREKGKYLPAARVSTHMSHVGVTIGGLDPALRFYRDVLGFQDIWRGSSSGRVLSWVNMRVPEGGDYLEFMLYATPPDEEQRGVKNHVCLVTPDIEKAVAVLKARAGQCGYTRPIEIKAGVNRKRQANLFDPDGTRIELMEPDTIDGKPAPSSTAPAPVREPPAEHLI